MEGPGTERTSKAGDQLRIPDAGPQADRLAALSEDLLAMLEACRGIQARWDVGEAAEESQRETIRRLHLSTLHKTHGIHTALAEYLDKPLVVETRLRELILGLTARLDPHLPGDSLPTAHEAQLCSEKAEAVREVWRQIRSALSTMRSRAAGDGDKKGPAGKEPSAEETIASRLQDAPAAVALRVLQALKERQEEWLTAGMMDEIGLPSKTVLSASKRWGEDRKGGKGGVRTYRRTRVIQFVVQDWSPKPRPSSADE